MQIKKMYLLLGLVFILFLSACDNSPYEFKSHTAITVVSREDGSGTRGAFIELFKVEEKSADGSRVDRTTEEAIIANKTNIMLGNVASNPYGIGYVSIGSLSDDVKAVQIDNHLPTGENIANGSYTISRPFSLAVRDQSNLLTTDFIAFILSSDGQAVVSHGYVPINPDPPSFQGESPDGKLVIAGSSSVTPIMEKLKEAYAVVNVNAKIEIQQSDSSTGLQSVIDGTSDIAMVSRDLTEKESSILIKTPIALDGIAVIVNKDNPIENMSKDQVRDIFIGQIIQWDQLVAKGESSNA